MKRKELEHYQATQVSPGQAVARDLVPSLKDLGREHTKMYFKRKELK